MNFVKLYSYAFQSDVPLNEVRDKFKELTSWKWYDRDNDRWGEYLSARVLSDPHRGMIKLFVEPGNYVINILFESEKPEEALPLCEVVEKTIFDTLLPAIRAHDLVKVDDYE